MGHTSPLLDDLAHLDSYSPVISPISPLIRACDIERIDIPLLISCSIIVSPVIIAIMYSPSTITVLHQKLVGIVILWDLNASEDTSLCGLSSSLFYSLGAIRLLMRQQTTIGAVFKQQLIMNLDSYFLSTW